MAALIFRGRSLRSRRKGRSDHGDDVVTLDYRKGVKENMNEVLVNLVKQQGVSKARRLGYFNALVRLCHRFPSHHLDLPYSKLQILACIRTGFFHDAKEMRAVCLRALRHFIQDTDDIEAMIQLNIPYLISRSLDISLDNELERIQALRLVRHIMHISPHRLPIALVNAVVAIVDDGAKDSDKMLQVSLATLCELALSSPEMMARCGGINTLLHSIQDSCHLARINESVLSTLLYLLNHPRTRHLIKPDTDLEQMLAPFTDSHYRPQGDKISEKDQTYLEERELQMNACKLAISTTMKSWPGIIRMCSPDGSGLQSLLGVLYLPNMDTRREIMDILYDIFDLPLPIWSEDFAEVLLSVDPSRMREIWKLKEGFVAQEGQDLLPHLATTRTNLAENQKALLLSTFISAGVLEALVEVITMGATSTSIRATILVGELLHMANRLLPPECNHHGNSLPSLISLATSFHIPAEQRHRASKAVNNLERFHAIKKRDLVPCSLFLDHLVQCVQSRAASSDSSYRPLRLTREVLAQSLHGRDGDHDLVNQAVRDSQVLMTKDNLSWDWDLILSLLKWPDESLHKLEDQSIQRFVRRLIFFYKPTSKLFAATELTRPALALLMGLVGMHLIDFLLDCDNDDGVKYLQEWLSDISQCLSDIKDSRNSLDILLTPGYLQHTCSQYYFLFLGRFSSTPSGEKLLINSGIYQMLLDLCTGASQDVYIKLILSSLDYTRDGISRLLLSKGLTSTSESARLYAVRLLRVLLRARVPFFGSWGLELLTSQVYDQSQTVALEALSVLQEACEDEIYLASVVKMKPTVLHLGYSGTVLMARFLSIPQGFKFLSETGFLSAELEKWEQTLNMKYVSKVEEMLNEAYTSYEKSIDGSLVRRSTDNSKQELNRDVLVPVHLYGELAQHQDGFQLLLEQDCVMTYLELIRHGDMLTDDMIMDVKTALWAVGHIGSCHLGSAWLQDELIFPEVIRLAEECGVFSVRGTAFYVLGLMASTHGGAAVLADYGWESLRRRQNEAWALSEDLDSEVGERVFPGTSAASLAASGSFYNRTASNSSLDAIELPAITVGLNHNGNEADLTVPSSASARANFFLGSSALGTTQSSSSIKTISESTSLDELTEENSSLPPVIESSRQAGRDSRELVSASVDMVPMQCASDPIHGKAHPLTNHNSLHSSWQGREPSRSANEVSKSRCESFDTSTSGISSYDSAGPIQSISEQPHLTPIPSANSISSENGNSQTNSKQESLDESMHPSDILRKMSNLKRVPSYKRRFSNPVLGHPAANMVNKSQTSHGSPHSLSGYAALRQLRKERAHSVDIEGENDVSLLVEETHTSYASKTRSLDFRSTFAKTSSSMRPSSMYEEADSLVPHSKRGLMASLPSAPNSRRRVSLDLPFTELPDTTSPSSRSASFSRSFSLSAPHIKSSPRDYVGICLPVDITLMYQVHEGEDLRSQPRHSPDSLHDSLTDDSVFTNGSPRPQRSMSEDDPDAALEYHSPHTCLACCQFLLNNTRDLETDLGDKGNGDSYPKGLVNLDQSVTAAGKMAKLRASNLSEAASQQALPSSVSSFTSVDSVTASHRTGMCEDSPAGVLLIRKEILRLLVNLSSSVATKSMEQGLLILRQRFSAVFQDICLYSEVCYMLAHFHYRLAARRFIQELFTDVCFDKMFEESQRILGVEEAPPTEDGGTETEPRLERVSEAVT